MKRISLITGGARSGKSSHAISLAQSIADVVIEMQAVKHPCRDGVSAQKGIEF
jgi:ATP:corrinoid adenosyltransferase